MEVWKDIKGYEGYQVSNKGRIRTCNKTTYSQLHGIRHWKDRIIKQKTAQDKAMRVELWKDGKGKTVLVHRIVALTFLGEPPQPNMTVNHIDGNRKNNHVENLEWLSLADNIRHGYRTGLYSSIQKPCILIDEAGNEYKFISQAEANKFLGRNKTYVGLAIRKNRKITNNQGKIFTYKEDV